MRISVNMKKFLISQETTLLGPLQASTGGRINGTVNGDVKITGHLLISKTAQVRGEVYADDIEIYGQVYGNIVCTNKVVIHDKAYIKGNITALMIEIKEGAVIEGFIIKSVSPDAHIEQIPAAAESIEPEAVVAVAVAVELEKPADNDHVSVKWF